MITILDRNLELSELWLNIIFSVGSWLGSIVQPYLVDSIHCRLYNTTTISTSSATIKEIMMAGNVENQKAVISTRVDRGKLSEIRKLAKTEYRSISNFLSMLVDKCIVETRERDRQNQEQHPQ
jgi:hypothetical protein